MGPADKKKIALVPCSNLCTNHNFPNSSHCLYATHENSQACPAKMQVHLHGESSSQTPYLTSPTYFKFKILNSSQVTAGCQHCIAMAAAWCWQSDIHIDISETEQTQLMVLVYLPTLHTAKTVSHSKHAYAGCIYRAKHVSTLGTCQQTSHTQMSGLDQDEPSLHKALCREDCKRDMRECRREAAF